VGVALRKLFLTSVILASLLFSSVALVEADDPPRGIHLTWSTDDTAHTITVTWQTSLEGSGETVLYDAVSRDGAPGLYSYSAAGVTHTYDGASGYIHEVELVGLDAETTYFFVVGGEAGGWSGEMAFRTAPVGRRDVRFVVGGDSRTNPDDRDLVSAAMREFSPGFVLFSGDLVNDGVIQEEWDGFFGHMDEYWTGADGLTIPIVPALGNHEKNSVNYFGQFALPGNEEWFSLDWGPDIHVVVLNSEASVEGLEAQTAWLEEDLEEHADFPWKVVMLHRNIMPSYHDMWLTALNRWVPVWDTHGVDLVVTGHSHNYMRSNPVNLTASMDEAMSGYSEGVMYLSSGGWGAPLYETVDGWWVAHTESTLHFSLIDVYANGTLHVQAKGVDGVTFDEARIHKEIPDVEELMAGRLEALGSELETLEEEKSGLEGEVSSLEEEIASLEEEKGSLQSELDGVRSQVDALEAEVADLVEELEGSEEGAAGLAATLAELEDTINDLNNQIEAQGEEVEILRGALLNRTMILGMGLITAVLLMVVLEIRRRTG